VPREDWSIHVAHERIRDCNEDTATEIAESAGIVSSYTSYVMTSDEAIAGATGMPAIAHIPQSSTAYIDLPMFSRSPIELSCSDSMVDYKKFQASERDAFDEDDEFDLDLSQIEKYLNRRIFKVQTIDFELLKLCGAPSPLITNLEECYRDVLEEGDEIFNIENFVARFILWCAYRDDYEFSSRVSARLERAQHQSEHDWDELFMDHVFF
jgi:hypothetical protein